MMLKINKMNNINIKKNITAFCRDKLVINFTIVTYIFNEIDQSKIGAPARI